MKDNKTLVLLLVHKSDSFEVCVRIVVSKLAVIANLLLYC